MSADARLAAAAERLLEAGPLPGEDLARRLYGAAGPVAPWVRMLERLLSGRDGFVRGEDGVWSLRAAEGSAPLLVAGRRHGSRLAALACAAADAPGVVWRWAFDLSDRPAEPAGDGEDDLPVPFGGVADELADLLRGRELLVLDARLPAALSSELELSGSPPLANACRVVGRDLWLHEGRKRSMAQVRALFGLPSVAADELLGEIEVIGAVAARPDAQPRAETRDRRHGLRPQAAALPEAPGVYTFVDAAGTALYVGSSVCLRCRVLSYFGEQTERARELRGLMERAERIEHVRLGTHLEAVAEEARMIERLRPPYNTQRAVSAHPAWLRIGAEPPVNVVQVATVPRGDAALYLGPLPNRTSVDAAASAVAVLWGLKRRGGSARTCPESLARLEELRGLLAEPERFCAELRRRFHAAGCLPVRRRAVLADHVERTERAALAGELTPAEPGAGDRLVARYDEEEGDLSLLLVRGFALTACARPSASGPGEIEAAIRQLLRSDDTVGRVPAEHERLVARWLHKHREDEWVLPLGGDAEELAAALTGAIRRHREDRAGRMEPAEAADGW